MKVRLNSRGIIFTTVTIILIVSSVLFRVPSLILISSLAVTYLISYPLFVRRLAKPNVSLTAVPRHGVVFRGEVDVIKIEITNQSATSIPIVVLKILMPTSIYIVNKPDSYIFSLDPYAKHRLTIPILPVSRGSHIIGPLTLNIGDPLLLFEENIATINEIPIRVYPKRLGRRVSKSKSREIFSKLIGLFATTQRGLGTDFHGLRDYIRGDPVKIINWHATARAIKLISKEFEEEKRLEVIIAVASGTTTRGNKFDF
ncbi:MAG: DUF58 domain-containing protein, partial [Candidatus Kariarchaeaceae archaeon]